MPLTMQWWKEQKNKAEHKVGGKVAPDTLFDKELKEYEAARTALEKDPGIKNVDAALKALEELKNAVKPSVTALEAAKYDALAKQLKLDNTFKKEKDALDKLKDELVLAWKMEGAGSQQEAVYEALWATYEKQRDTLATAPSVQLYKNTLSTLDKLIDQAEKCRTSNPKLATKYNKLEGGLKAALASTTTAQQAYGKAIADAAKARADLLPDFKAAKATLDAALVSATQLAKDAATAKAEKNSFKLMPLIKKAGELETAAMKAYDDVNDKFKPGTRLRESLDVKAAKIHSDDSTAQIAPHTTALFTVNTQLVNVKRQFEQVIAAVKATKIG